MNESTNTNTNIKATVCIPIEVSIPPSELTDLSGAEKKARIIKEALADLLLKNPTEWYAMITYSNDIDLVD